jgi:hypothetical protein
VYAQSAPPITSNDYALEIFQGPLLAPIHVVGVGGAYIALAEDTEGSAVNAAAPAVRDPYSTTWFDYDLSLGLSFPGAFVKTDFDNHGDQFTAMPHANVGNFLDLNVGATLQFGGLGVAATGDLQQFSITTAAPGTPGLSLEIGRWKALAAYGLFDDQLVVGGGARIVTMQILQDNGGTLLTMTGAAPEAGALLMPTGRPWRIGLTARAPVRGGGFGSENVTQDADGTRRVGAFVLPSQVVMPWEAEIGVAYQLGPRPLNPGWSNPHVEEARLREMLEQDRAERRRRYEDDLARLSPEGRAARTAQYDVDERSLRAIEDQHMDEESRRLRAARRARYENWPREKILLLASVLTTGASSNATSLEGFLDKQFEKVGGAVTYTPRLGLEAEPIQNRMLLRTGTYIEPSRYEGGTARQHFTFGTDVRLFPLDFWGLMPPAIWKLELFADIAPRYTNWGIGIGNWH